MTAEPTAVAAPAAVAADELTRTPLLTHEVGSLEPGKLADIVLWELDDLDHAGIEDPVAALVLGPRPLAHTVIVDGQVVIRHGELLTGDVEEITRELAEVAMR